MSQQPLNVAMIGGGEGSFIGTPHQKAIHFDGTRRLRAVVLRSSPEKSMREAANWPYPVTGYPSYDALFDAQADLPPEERIDYVVIVTPNFAHFDPAMKALELGIPVMCEKPLTVTLEEANLLASKAKEKNIPFAVAHTYLGHWSSWFCRHVVQSGLLGDVRWIDSYYIQGWLADKIEDSGQTQAAWRTDPKKAGRSGCGGDIGTHALMQLRFVTGLEVTRVSARLETFVPDRPIDDHFTTYGELSNGGKCLVRASQICIGHKNDLGITIAGTLGSLKWNQEEPEKVTILLPNQPDRIYWRGQVCPNDGFLGDIPQSLLDEPTIPSGHGEAFHDAYARLHREFEKDVRAYKTNSPWKGDGSTYATVDDGRVGMAFIEACLKSNALDGAWETVL